VLGSHGRSGHDHRCRGPRGGRRGAAAPAGATELARARALFRGSGTAAPRREDGHVAVQRGLHDPHHARPGHADGGRGRAGGAAARDRVRRVRDVHPHHLCLGPAGGRFGSGRHALPPGRGRVHGREEWGRARPRRRPDYLDSQYNRATQAMRQPGSAFKPFVYAAAVAAGYPPSHRILDSRSGWWGRAADPGSPATTTARTAAR
jgi:hypothetical protein